MKDGGSFHKHKKSTPILITFTFFCFLFLGSRADALVFCVGCAAATGGTCTGGGGATDCTGGDNGVVCPTIADAIDDSVPPTVVDGVIDSTSATDEIRIAASMVPYTGPGSTAADLTTFAVTPKTALISGGWNDTSTSRIVNPLNTVISAPGGDRVFDIDAGTLAQTLNITIDGVTIQLGTPGSGDGGGIRAMATGMGGSLSFTSTNNTYDTNAASGDGGGLSVEAGPGSATVLIDANTFINNSAVN